MGEDVGGDLDEVGLELSGVPVGEDLGYLGRGHSQTVAQEGEGLTDELHIGVFDAVVDHLDEVPGSVGADVIDAGFVSDLRGNGFEQGTQALPRGLRSADHERGSEQSADLSPGDADPGELDAGALEAGPAGDRVPEVGVAAVDDDVTGNERLGEIADRRIRGASGIDHEDGHPRFGEFLGQVGRIGGDDELGFGEVSGQPLGALDVAVVDGDSVARLTGEVAGQVRPHHAGSDHRDIGLHEHSSSL